MTEHPSAILLVDDDEDNRYTLKHRLQRDGFGDVVEAKSGRDALDLVRTRPFDLVLLDQMMPEMDGHEVLRALKADMALRDIPVIMISALDTAIDTVVRCIQLGAEDYLPKPFNPTLFRARISASLEKKRLRDQQASYLALIENEKKRSDDLLRAVLPPGAIRELKATSEIEPRRYEGVAVLFCDIVGFTSYCDAHPPEQVVADLQGVIERFERVVAKHGMEKIKTIGDALLATAGLLQEVDEPLVASVRCGLDLVAAARETKPHWSVRVGIHHGPVVAGIVGRRQFLFDLWGDTVNTAARVVGCASVNSVFMASPVWMRVRDRCRARSRGLFDLKGKGTVELVECYEVS